MSVFHYFEILIFGEKAFKIKKTLQDKREKIDDLISRIEVEKMLSQTEDVSEATSEKETFESELKPSSEF